MPPRADPARSPLSLVLLALLFEQPMHPYRMQKLIGERGKDEVVNIRSRSSILQTVERLERDGLVTDSGTEQEGNYPPRTVYALTEAGHEQLLCSLRDLLSTPTREFPTFPAALSLMAILSPRSAAELLRRRRSWLAESLARRSDGTAETAHLPPRILLIENEYVVAMRNAEIAWLDQVIDAIDTGSLNWDPHELIKQAHWYE
jgi:DNA-binding PadR family transcriptional regulator